jgi:cytochrome b subunit of formate dehydrogenase
MLGYFILMEVMMGWSSSFAHLVIIIGGIIIFELYCGPGFDSASNGNEYQESSWG